MTKKIRTYNELLLLNTFKDRYDYLKLKGSVGETIFGFDRHLNQLLYTSMGWRRTRNEIIIRDNGCDLGMPDRVLYKKLLVHHMNPITIEDIENNNPSIYDPRYLICTSEATHLAIHYGDENLLQKLPIQRKPHDTTPWL